MIKITGGVFGMRDAKGLITYKTERDEPFSLSEEEEERLVCRGVAEYVNYSGKAEQESEEAEQKPSRVEREFEEAAPEELVLSEKMKLDELKEIALDYDLDCKSMRSKAEVIAAIKEVQGHDKEDAPQLGAAEPQI